MANNPAEVRAGVLANPPSCVAETLRYGLSMLAVVAIGFGIAAWLGQVELSQDASEVASAVTIDLPPVDASAQPARRAADSPEQAVVRSSGGQHAPEQVQPKSEEDRPVEEPPPMVRPDPPAVLERKAEPTPPTTAPSPPRQEQAPAGAEQPAKADATDSNEARHHASTHVMTLWQRSLMQRLATAKRPFDREHFGGRTVEVAFDIDAAGALVADWIAQSSGSPTIDQAALLLVRRAAPFPTPPPGSSRRERSFIVPVRFR